jgi:hypothetical protein
MTDNYWLFNFSIAVFYMVTTITEAVVFSPLNRWDVWTKLVSVKESRMKRTTVDVIACLPSEFQEQFCLGKTGINICKLSILFFVNWRVMWGLLIFWGKNFTLKYINAIVQLILNRLWQQNYNYISQSGAICYSFNTTKHISGCWKVKG